MILEPAGESTAEEVASLLGKSAATSRTLPRFRAWHYLTLACAAFWAVFAIVLITTNFLFLVGLLVVALLSFLVILLAWAYQNDF